MGRIHDFKSFVNEAYKVNEGGGAGIEFKVGKVSVTFQAELSAGAGLDIKKQDISMDDTYNAHGYDDGMSDVGTWMFKTELDEIKDKNLLNIKLDSISNATDLLNDLDIPESEHDKIETIADLLKASPESVLDIVCDLTFKDYREMHFAGYIRGSFKKDEVIIGNSDTKYDSGDYDSLTINGYDVQIEGSAADFVDELKPQLKAKESFLDFYKAVFSDMYENFEKFMKDELIENDIEEGRVDDEIQEYIENNDMEITLEDFKKDKKKYVTDDFVDFMKNKGEYNDSKWDVFLSMTKEDWSKENPGGRED